MADRIAVLRAGRVEQLASPTELYERPASRFVAEFIGSTNLIERDGRTVSVRPERVTIVPGRDGATGPHRLHGVVADVQFYGGVSHVNVAVPGRQRPIVATVVGSTDLARDDEVAVTWEPTWEVEIDDDD